MRTLIPAIVALGLAVSASAQEQKPAPKADEKAAASIAGKWTMAVETQNGAMNTGLDLKQEDKKITGTISGPQGDAALAGEYADGKLTFNVTVQGNNGEVKLVFVGSLKADGTLAGSMNYGQGDLNWTATRAK
jgi:hypothetical protein